MSIEDLITVKQLAARLGKTAAETMSLLEELRVPVIRDTLSSRLLMSRMEAGGPTEDVDPIEAAGNHLGRLGVHVRNVRNGRPVTLQLHAPVPTLIGTPGFDGDPAWARTLLAPGRPLFAVLQIARKRPATTADYNVQFDRRRRPFVPDVHLFYLLDEDRMWLVKRSEFDDLRANHQRGPSDRGQPFSFFPVGAGGSWRVAFGRELNDFDACCRIEPRPIAK